MLIEALDTIIQWDAGRMVVINPGETGELSDDLAQAEVDAGKAKPAKAGKAKPAPASDSEAVADKAP